MTEELNELTKTFPRCIRCWVIVGALLSGAISGTLLIPSNKIFCLPLVTPSNLPAVSLKKKATSILNSSTPLKPKEPRPCNKKTL